MGKPAETHVARLSRWIRAAAECIFLYIACLCAAALIALAAYVVIVLVGLFCAAVVHPLRDAPNDVWAPFRRGLWVLGVPGSIVGSAYAAAWLLDRRPSWRPQAESEPK